MNPEEDTNNLTKMIQYKKIMKIENPYFDKDIRYEVVKAQYKLKSPNPNKEEDWSTTGKRYPMKRQIESYLTQQIVDRRKGNRNTKFYFGSPEIRPMVLKIMKRLSEKERKRLEISASA